LLCAISLLRLWGGREITAARQYYAGHPAALFRQLGLSPPGLWISPFSPQERLQGVYRAKRCGQPSGRMIE